jgi:hypothetical protein
MTMGLFSKAVEAVKRKHTWPNTDPPDKSDPHWKFNNNLNCNGTPYRKEEVAPGQWQWVVDQKIMKLTADRERHRRDLYWALRSRILTDDEMKEVEQYGDYLNIEPMVSYSSDEKKRELNDALLQQFKLRLAAERALSPASGPKTNHTR